MTGENNITKVNKMFVSRRVIIFKQHEEWLRRRDELAKEYDTELKFIFPKGYVRKDFEAGTGIIKSEAGTRAIVVSIVHQMDSRINQGE